MNKIDENIYKDFKPLPEDLRGWNGDNKLFGELIAKYKPVNIIEVGSWKGQSAINMGKLCKENNLSTKIYCIDTWLGSVEFWCDANKSEERSLKQKHGYPQIYYQFISNVIHNKMQDYILPLPMSSSIGWKYCNYFKIKADMIYIDASHEEGDVIYDMNHYWPLVKQGGIMFGDDYHKFWSGVIHDVDLFCEQNKLKLQTYENNFEGDFWVLQKKINA